MVGERAKNDSSRHQSSKLSERVSKLHRVAMIKLTACIQLSLSRAVSQDPQSGTLSNYQESVIAVKVFS